MKRSRYLPRRRRSWLSEQLRRRPLPVWVVALIHLVALGLALVLFALPHHVIPRSRASLGVIVSRDAAPVQAAAEAEPAEAADAGAAPAATQPPADAGGSAPSFVEQPAAAPEATPAARVGDFSAKFADKFVTGDPVITDSSYVSENLNLVISEYYVNRTRFYVMDIYIRDISCFRRSFAKGKYGRNITEGIRKVAYREQSVASINGDFYGIREGGVCLVNGELYYSDEVVREICVLYWDGSLKCFQPGEFDCDREIANGAYQIWNFGPAMLDENRNPRPEFGELYEGIYGNQPRSALGYFEPGHYCFITADGRNDDSRGLTMDQLGLLAQNLGCEQCYNMDGGRTAQMTFGTEIVNHPVTGGRPCSDYLSIVDRIS